MKRTWKASTGKQQLKTCLRGLLAKQSNPIRYRLKVLEKADTFFLTVLVRKCLREVLYKLQQHLLPFVCLYVYLPTAGESMERKRNNYSRKLSRLLSGIQCFL